MENRGEFVVLRAFGDEAVIRRIWETTDKTVVVCDDEQYQRKLQGDDLPLLGFPREFVYIFDADAVEKGVLKESDWWLRLHKWTDC